MYKKILVPVDGSEVSSLAVEHCVGLLEKQQPEKVVLFHVANYPSQLESYSGKMRTAMIDVKEQLKEHGEDILLKAKNTITAKNAVVTVETKLVWGDPKYGIVEEAEEGKYDLLIIGSRGHSGIKGFLLGSVGNYVAQHVKCTVMLVKE